MPDEIIRKSDLARELGVSHARVSQLVRGGLPVRPDGRLDRARGLAWVRANNFSWLVGAGEVRGPAGNRAGFDSGLDEMEKAITPEDWAELENSVREVLER
jgi:hypothetical protein